MRPIRTWHMEAESPERLCVGAGSIIQEESDRVAPVPVGHVALTGAGSLAARAVIHAVGPRMGE
jgi:O-acetyl-ADP-ribose deacetylase (regulator of RNase III)